LILVGDSDPSSPPPPNTFLSLSNPPQVGSGPTHDSFLALHAPQWKKKLKSFNSQKRASGLSRRFDWGICEYHSNLSHTDRCTDIGLRFPGGEFLKSLHGVQTLAGIHVIFHAINNDGVSSAENSGQSVHLISSFYLVPHKSSWLGK
jgi:hypothetical protein